MRTTIPWGDGTGDNIYLDYDASAGNQNVAVSSDANQGASERQKNVVFSASGTNPVTLLVTQAGASPSYIRVLYLMGEGGASQFIDLPYGFERTDELYLRGSIIGHSADKYIISPSTWNNNSNRFGIEGASIPGGQNALRYGVGFGAAGTSVTIMTPATSPDNYTHIWSYADNKFKVDDLNLELDVSSISFGGQTSPLRLFYGYNAPTIAKIEEFWQKKNGVKVIHLLPVRDSNGVGYMHDIVNDVLYSPSSPLLVGSDDTIPSGYTRVQYVQSAGSASQYVELPYGFDSTDELLLEAAVLNTNADKFVIAPSTWNNNRNRFAIGGTVQTGSGRKFGVGFGNSSTGSTPLSPMSNPDTGNHLWQYKNGVFSMFRVDDNGYAVSTMTLNTSGITWGGTTTHLRLFYGYNAPTSARITEFWQKKNGVKVIHLIPVRDSNYVGYLYDTVNNVLYSSGGAAFTVGSDVPGII